MSQLHEHDPLRQTATATGERSWERPAAADDIVDPIDIGPDGTASGVADDPALYREQTDEEAEDVPLEVKFTDALSMLADGGHDYGSHPVIEDEIDGEVATGEDGLDVIEIDESSKDA